MAPEQQTGIEILPAVYRIKVRQQDERLMNRINNPKDLEDGLLAVGYDNYLKLLLQANLKRRYSACLTKPIFPFV